MSSEPISISFQTGMILPRVVPLLGYLTGSLPTLCLCDEQEVKIMTIVTQ